jgi:hypothetical protein
MNDAGMPMSAESPSMPMIAMLFGQYIFAFSRGIANPEPTKRV